MSRVPLLFLLAAFAAGARAEGGNIQRFSPEPATLGGLATGPGELLGVGDWAGGLDLNWAHNPLVRRESGTRGPATVADNVTLQVRAAVGLHEIFEFALVLPIAAYVGGDDATATIAGHAAGDLRLQPRIRLLTQWRHGVALSVSPTITLPLGGTAALAGDAGVTLLPEATISKRFEKLFLAGNLSFHLRPEATILPGATLGSELGLRFAAGYALSPDTQLLGELDGGLALSTLSLGALGTPLELRLGMRHFLGDTMALDLAAGTGLLSAPGTPDVRVIAGFVFGKGLRPLPGTSCLRESATGPEAAAARGSDRDGDGVDDGCDVCPDEAESVNGYRDLDGCREADRDADGIYDDADSCPELAGPGPRGCPDTDGDGLLDDVDRCAKDPEDRDGFLDDDGCPDLDDDKDGVPDVADKCRLQPEDKDGFEDADGCPELDNDGDGVPDAADKCPDEKETINGFEDEDGCPDKGRSLVVVKAEKLEILEKVFFATGLAEIEERSFGLLKQVALTLKAFASIKQIRVEGHTDDVGGRETNLDLSRRRAEAVRLFLANAGVGAERLLAEGYAFDRPLLPNTSEQSRATNRRVEFVIVEEAKP